MSAIHTMASVNVEEDKKRKAQLKPLGWIGAARKLWTDYVSLAKGLPDPVPAEMAIPPCHSEFLTDYQDQLTSIFHGIIFTR